MLRAIKVLVVLVVVCLAVAFALSNSRVVTVDYLAGQVDLSLVVVTIGALIVGFLLALLLCSSRILLLRAEARRLRKRMDSLDAQLKDRRNPPLHNV